MDNVIVPRLGSTNAASLRSENSGVAATPHPETLLRLPKVIGMTGLSRATIYRLITAGQFPRQVKLSQRASAWSGRAVAAWIADRLNSAA